MPFTLPLIYPILDSSFIPKDDAEAYLDRVGHTLADAGVRLLEYRNKMGTDAEVLTHAGVLRRAMPVGNVKLILDDRVDIALAAEFDGVHVDNGDLPAADARALVGPDWIVGTSASARDQLMEAMRQPVDYIAFGPVFETTTKQTPVAPIGIDGVRRFRQAAGPSTRLVAAAGITFETVAAILGAGADAVAVSAALFRFPDPAAEFRRWERALGVAIH